MSDARLEAAGAALYEADRALRSFIESPPQLLHSAPHAAYSAFKAIKAAQAEIDYLRQVLPQ